MSATAKLTLPALRAYMGDWVYYIAAMRLADVADRINFAEEIHKSSALREMIQRTLDESKHATQISNYLLQDKQRLFNSLVVGVYGGSPEWHELKIRDAETIDPNLEGPQGSGVLGFLSLNGHEKLFALDGQHRVSGIKIALKAGKSLKDEELSVIFVAHSTTSQGLERTRRLFTRLNRFAKPVRKEEIIALDEDDSVAILTRQFVDDELNWKEKVSLAKTKAMPVTDHKSVTTVSTLYDALDDYLGAKTQNWSDFKRMRPTDKKLKALKKESKQLWSALGRAFPVFGKALKLKDPTKIVSAARSSKGGHIIFRPIGLQIIVRTIVNFQKTGVSLASAVKKIAKIRMELSEAPWSGVLWNTTKRRMLTVSENKKAAHQLLFWLSGGDLTLLKSSPDKLQRELEGILNLKAGELDMQSLKRQAKA